MLSTIGSVASQNGEKIIVMNKSVVVPEAWTDLGDADFNNIYRLNSTITLKSYNATTGELSIDYTIICTSSLSLVKVAHIYFNRGLNNLYPNISFSTGQNKTQTFTGSTTVNIGIKVPYIYLENVVWSAQMDSDAIGTSILGYTFTY